MYPHMKISISFSHRLRKPCTLTPQFVYHFPPTTVENAQQWKEIGSSFLHRDNVNSEQKGEERLL